MVDGKVVVAYSRFIGYEKGTLDIAMGEIRRREFGRFIWTVEKLPQVVTDFDEAL